MLIAEKVGSLTCPAVAGRGSSREVEGMFIVLRDEGAACVILGSPL